jgi:hypothetical protein
VRRSNRSWTAHARSGDPVAIETAEQRPKLEPDNTSLIDKYADNPFASAVAVVLGAGQAEEAKLVQVLDKWHDTLVDEMGRDFALEGEDTVTETFRPALSFMAAVALAWLHAKRRADAGSPLPGDVGFPSPPAVTDSSFQWCHLPAFAPEHADNHQRRIPETG